jgi:hypothetical protein
VLDCLLQLRTLRLALAICVLNLSLVLGKSSQMPGRAIIVDEKLAALRVEPKSSANLIRRLSRGRRVIINERRTISTGESFCRVAVTRRTRGWVLCASLVSPIVKKDDLRLLNLIKEAQGFERMARAKIFLDQFAASPYRPEVLLLEAEAAENAAAELTREAERKFRREHTSFTNAPAHLYYLNYSGLDRLNRLGVKYIFDSSTKQFRYDGAAWREIVRRYPRSPEAERARQFVNSQLAFSQP